MVTTDFSTSVTAKTDAMSAFTAIQQVSGWWCNQVSGKSQKSGDEFETRFGDVHYSKQKLGEVIPGRKMEWLVTDSFLSFLEDKTEWTGTSILFELEEVGEQTRIRFTHRGLVPEAECYDACSPAWMKYLKFSLIPFIERGKGQPGFPPAGPLK